MADFCCCEADLDFIIGIEEGCGGGRTFVVFSVDTLEDEGEIDFDSSSGGCVADTTGWEASTDVGTAASGIEDDPVCSSTRTTAGSIDIVGSTA